MADLELINMRRLRTAHSVLVDFFKDEEEPIPPWEDGDQRLLETLCYCTEVYDKYPDLESKAAKLFYSAVKLHCFPNGNKRFGLVVLLAFLVANDYRLTATQFASVEIATWVADSDPHTDEGKPDAMVATLTEFIRQSIEPFDWSSAT